MGALAALVLAGGLTVSGEWRDLAEHMVAAGKAATVSCAQTPGEVVTRWEWELQSLERRTDVLRASTTTPTWAAKPARVGHYLARVRACNTQGCGAWSDSTDPATGMVDGQPRGWVLFFFVAPPSGGGIN